MASTSTSRPADDGNSRYVVNYRDPEGRQRRKRFRRRAEAVAFRNSVEADKLRGTYRDVDPTGSAWVILYGTSGGPTASPKRSHIRRGCAGRPPAAAHVPTQESASH